MRLLSCHNLIVSTGYLTMPLVGTSLGIIQPLLGPCLFCGIDSNTMMNVIKTDTLFRGLIGGDPTTYLFISLTVIGTILAFHTKRSWIFFAILPTSAVITILLSQLFNLSLWPPKNPIRAGLPRYSWMRIPTSLSGGTPFDPMFYSRDRDLSNPIRDPRFRP